MKHVLLSISILCSINCFSQEPNPDLFQTWYLSSVLVSDGSEPIYIVSDIEPEITPTLTILEDLSFYGTAACNTFNGIFNLPYSDVLETDQLSHSTDDCGIEIHNDFEDAYFNFIQLLSGYAIFSVDEGLVLQINTPIFGAGVFRNFPLNISEFELNKIEIYPNPTTSLIHLKSKNSSILKIEIFNAIGQNVKSIKNNFDTINISDLPIGIYIIKLDTELGMVNKKIIKE